VKPRKKKAGAMPSKAVARQIRELVAADLEPAPARSADTRSFHLLLALALALGLAAVAFGGNLSAPGQRRRDMAVGLGVLLAGSWLVTRAMPFAAPSRAMRLAPVALGAGWVAYLFYLASLPGGPEASTLTCVMISSLAGLAGVAVGHWAWRFTDPWQPARTGALIGLVAGCVGAAGVSVACDHHGLVHLLVGHGMALLLLAGLSAAIAPRTLRP
jgi:hypothetical protein